MPKKQTGADQKLGIGPRDRGTGTVARTSGSDRRFGLGQFRRNWDNGTRLHVDDKRFIINFRYVGLVNLSVSCKVDFMQRI